MTSRDADQIRQELKAVAAELAKMDELTAHRDELIDRARSLTPPLTMREVAQLLGMTERGANKALNAYRERSHRLAS